ncbi:type II toxin-antitoxin system RelE/ParE family toxin [Algoriphagus antarcticus]|uniref:ParE-like toxin of type II ParDE toxin-antitoxin system n=1 Tax=Algoriphagus antarcticus TaxID=238540 RepID=A0A3E0DHA8_9BACT|nr:type II toxin-antitoxin system RelE/ParE family toxin [Algoriphagus antarcticus]REG82058.1 ParE-like toxin of type II ParDE toxin-antitoxin system [Algoriphagus antarcticus]
MNFEIKEEARRDLLIAFSYYEDASADLGEKFFKAIEVAFAFITKSPESYQVKRGSYREFRIRKFPFLIVYSIDSDSIVVYSVFNTWKNPNKKP